MKHKGFGFSSKGITVSLLVAAAFSVASLLQATNGAPKSSPTKPTAFIYSKHFYNGNGYPIHSRSGNQWVFHDIFVTCNNPETKFTDWVAYRLTENETGGFPKSRYWKADSLIPNEATLEPRPWDDYAGTEDSGYDRGHMVPLASVDGAEEWRQANFLSNITPQMASFNRGTWKRLEDRVRTLVSDHHTVWVMAGTLYESEMKPLPNANEDHVVPSGFWKIVIWEDGGDLRCGSFIFSQTSKGELTPYLTTIDAVESRTGLDFFWWLPQEEQSVLESVSDIRVLKN
jgi:endonuclease G